MAGFITRAFDYADCVLAGTYDRLGITPPTLSPARVRQIVREIFAEHGMSPLSPVGDLLEVEGYDVVYASTPCGCGVSLGQLLVVPQCRGRAHQYLLAQHERSHGWIRRKELWGANEADAWLVTAELVWPSWLREGDHRQAVFLGHPHAPGWFLVAVAAYKAA